MREPRFIVDVNVGRLAKWLRAMGYDTLYIPGMEDGELIRRALAEDRILLTRDTRILHRRVATSGQLKVVLLSHQALRPQLQEVIGTLGLKLSHPFMRCLQCNTLLEEVPKERVEDRVPPYVYRTQEEFMECPQCRKLYWRGTHWHNMRAELAEAHHAQR